MFGKQGFENTSVAEIVRDADVVKGTFYQHFAATVLRELKGEWPEHGKAIKGNFAHCIDQLDFANANARRVLLSAEANSSDNPSTRVHELVEYLQNIQSRKTLC